MAWLMGNHCGDHLVTDASFIWDFTGWNNNNDNNNNKFICETHIEIVIKQFLLHIKKFEMTKILLIIHMHKWND